MLLKCALFCLILVASFTDTGARADGGAGDVLVYEKTLPENKEYDRDFNRIDSLRSARNLSGLENLGDEIHATWGKSEDKDHYYILVDCLTRALNSADFGLQNVVKKEILARKYALFALQGGDVVPLDVRINLMSCTAWIDGFEHRNGQTIGHAWTEQRADRTNLWLSAWQRLDQAISSEQELIDAHPKSPLFMMNGIDGGLTPEQQTERNKANQQRNKWITQLTTQKILNHMKTSYSPLAENYLTTVYSEPPYDVDELKRLLDAYISNPATKARILDQVSRNVKQQASSKSSASHD